MIGECLKIGDVVTITIPKENREWGYNPFPDGTQGTVIGFEEKFVSRINNFCQKPGVYTNHSWVKLRLLDNREHLEYDQRLSLLDKKEQKRRERERRAKYTGDDPSAYWLRDLPETPFWEGDWVRCVKLAQQFADRVHNGIFMICGIDYSYLHKFCDDGITPYPAYRVSNNIKGGWQAFVREQELTLVKRGRVWQHFHGEKPNFPDLRSEVEFAMMLGNYDEVCNPDTKLYKWTKDEALAAIQNGTGHFFKSEEIGFFPGGSIQVIKLHDQDLAKRTRQVVLEEFGIFSVSEIG